MGDIIKVASYSPPINIPNQNLKHSNNEKKKRQLKIIQCVSARLLGDPTFIPAVNVPGLDYVTLNQNNYKFTPNSPFTGMLLTAGLKFDL